MSEDKKPNKFTAWIKNPRGFPLAVVYVATAGAAAGAILLTVFPEDGSPLAFLAYIVYIVAAALLAFSVYATIRAVPGLKRKAVRAMKKNELTNNMLESYDFRTIVFAVVSFVISAGYAAVNLTISVLDRSVWYGALAGYYILLALMRGGVLIVSRKTAKMRKIETADAELPAKRSHLGIYRKCGVLLIILPVCLTVAVSEMVVSNESFVHEGIMIYANAAYTFYKIVMSCVNFFKAGRGDNFAVKAIRNINLADALVSVFALQSAMFREFTPNADMRAANAVMGGLICLATAAIGIAMIATATVALRKLREGTKE